MTESSTEEIWRSIPGYDGVYSVSSAGRVKRDSTGRLLKPCSCKRDRYLRVYLYIDKKKRGFAVHTLVLLSFIGKRQPGYETRHLNGNPRDNRLCNLHWCKASKNLRYEEGGSGRPAGEANPRSRLTADIVKKVVTLYSQGYGVAELGRFYGITPPHVLQIVRRQLWSHLPLASAELIERAHNSSNRERSNSKLKRHQVEKIHKLRGEGVTIGELSREFQVSRSTIGKIVHGKTWKRVKAAVSAVENSNEVNHA